MRFFRLLSALGLVSLMMGAGAIAQDQVESQGRPRHIVMITVDDMSQDSVGAFGCKVADTTPHIDQLAAEGVRFVHAHVNIAVCQPCRAVWLTGLYPHRNGATGFNRINEGVETLPEALREQGFLTAVLGKTVHCVRSRTEAWEISHAPIELGHGRDQQLYYERAKEALEQAKSSDRPIFLLANTHDPHRPFANSAQEDKKFGDWEEEHGSLSEASRRFRQAEIEVPGFLADLPQVRREMAQYYTSVRRADDCVGAVLKAIDDTGLREQTVVMFMSDHGMSLPFSKTNCYFHSTRTPWIVRWPGEVEGGTVDEQHMVSGIDVTPTILEWAGLEPFAECDGRSIVSVLQGEQDPTRDHVFTQFNQTSGKRDYPMRAVVTRDYGYIFNPWSDGELRFRNESQNGLSMNAMRRAAENDPDLQARVDLFLYRVPEELYEYRIDPDALVNLIEDPSHDEVKNSLRLKLLRGMQASDDPLAEELAAFLQADSNSGR